MWKQWRTVGGRPAHLLIPLVVGLLAAALEGVSFSLLVPLSDAVTQGDFAGLGESRAFGWIERALPDALTGSPRRDAYLVLVFLGLVVASRAGTLLLDFGRDTFTHWRNETYSVLAQEHFFSRVLRFGRQYYDRQSLGQLDVHLSWARAPVDVLSATEYFVKTLLGLTAKAAVLVFVSVPLSLGLLVVFPAVLVLMRHLDRQFQRLAAEGAGVEVRAKARTLDLLATLPLVKALGQEGRAAAEYRGSLEEARDVSIRWHRLRALRWPLEEMLVLLGILGMQVILIAGSGAFSTADLARLAVFLIVVQQALPNLKGFGAYSMTLAWHTPKLRALAQVLGEQDRYVVESGTREMAGLTSCIRIRDLTFAYADGPPVLNGLSLEIPAGSFTAIVGESGAGKSTLAHLLARFYECPPATILLDGTDIRDFSLGSLQQRVGLVSQDVWILNRTLRENLTFGLAEPPSDEELLSLLDDLQLGSLVSERDAPLDLPLGERGVSLSGGQRQRVALARILLRSPDVVILDEATSALDSVSEQRLAARVRSRLAGRTLVVIAHRLSTVRDADGILVLQRGQVVEEGRWEDLVTRGGAFAALHAAQFGNRS